MPHHPLALLGALTFATLSFAGERRYILVDQSDFGASRGFYLDLENKSTDDNKPLEPSTINLILAVGDGKGWRYIPVTGRCPMGSTVTVDATITGDNATLTVNQTREAVSPGGFSPVDKPVTFADEPSWAHATSTYGIQPNSLVIENGAKRRSTLLDPSRSSRLGLFETPIAQKAPFQVDPTKPIVIHASFTVLPTAQTKDLKGAIDRFGQAADAAWPGKVVQESQLRSSATEEAKESAAWRWPAMWDEFGGDAAAPWHEKPTSFYRVLKRGDVWWLVSPKGNPLFYTGLCTAPAVRWDMTPTDGREDIFQELPPKIGPAAALWDSVSPWGDGPGSYFALHSYNLLRKFGPDWAQKAKDEFAGRYKSWAFSGQGKWADEVRKVPRVVVLQLDGVPRLGRHPDPFDPAVKQAVRESLRKQIEPLAKDPYILGLSLGNEYDEIITADEVQAVLRDHPNSPAAKSILATPGVVESGTTSLEKARQAFASAYYSLLYKTVKSLDPNHLYLGFWIVPGWWQNASDWDLIAPNCDIIGYDRYAHSYSGIENLLAKHDKPTLLGEFSVPGWYDGARGVGRYDASYVSTEADSGAAYAQWIAAASSDPKCVGAMWFQYRDEPISGRGPGKGYALVHGEHFAFGFVDITDRPKWDLVKPARKANLQATDRRLKIR